MPRRQVALIFALLCFAVACSPRDFLTRRLATDLIAGSDTFKMTQLFWLRTGVISNKDYTSPEYVVLRRRGWITGSGVACPPDLAPPPCWDMVITPLGVDALRDWVAATAASSQYISVPVAQRELLAVTGIHKNGSSGGCGFSVAMGGGERSGRGALRKRHRIQFHGQLYPLRRRLACDRRQRPEKQFRG